MYIFTTVNAGHTLKYVFRVVHTYLYTLHIVHCTLYIVHYSIPHDTCDI